MKDIKDEKPMARKITKRSMIDADYCLTEKYKITTKLEASRADEQNLSLVDIKDNLVGKEGYEVIYGPCIAYYDYESKPGEYDNEDDMLDYRDSMADELYDKIRTTFGEEARIFVFDSSGYRDKKANSDNEPGYWKISLHFRIRGVGYYTEGKKIPLIDICDRSVYKNTGSRQLMRLPYCTKDDKKARVLKQLVPLNGDWKIIEYQDIKDNYEDFLITNIKGETLIITEEAIPKKVQPKEHEVNEFPVACDSPFRRIDVIEKLIKLWPKNFNQIRDSWIRCVWALSGHAQKCDIDLLPLCKSFSRGDLTNQPYTDYNELAVEREYRNARTIGQQLGLTKMKEWARESDPAGLDILELEARQIQIQTLENPRLGYFEDLQDIIEREPKLTPKIVKDWMRSCIYLVLNGGSSVFYSRRKKDNERRPFERPFAGESSRIFRDGNKTYRFRDILIELQTDAQFNKQNVYHHVDFFPYFKDIESEAKIVPSNIFNRFGSFPVNMPKTADWKDPKIVQLTDHLRDILCGGSKELYELLLNWLAHKIQFPRKKVGVAWVFFSEKEGSGKSVTAKFIKDHIFGRKYAITLEDLNDLLPQRFNTHLLDKLFIIMEEAKDYESNHKQTDKLKSCLTRDTHNIEPKGKDIIENVNDMSDCWFLTNNYYNVKISDSDRRFYMVTCSDAKKGKRAYFKDLCDNVLTQETADKFARLLAGRDISTWDPLQMPKSDIHNDAQERSLDLPIKFIKDALTCSEAWPAFYEAVDIHEVTSKTFYTIFRDWAENFGIGKNYIPTRETVTQKINKYFKIETVTIIMGKERPRGWKFDKTQLRATFEERKIKLQ